MFIILIIMQFSENHVKKKRSALIGKGYIRKLTPLCQVNYISDT